MSINTVETIDDRVTVKTLIISVYDKTGLDVLVPALLEVNPGMWILSTGHTHAEIARILGTRASRNLLQVSSYTGQPEMQGGLVKTLDYKIYLGLLSETHNPAHQDDLRRFGATSIDMVVSNLYPFEKTVSSGATVEAARGNIDIGGPSMVRAAAKNFHRVAVVTDPTDYTGIVDELRSGGGALDLSTRFRLAQKAFRTIARYDAAIAEYISGISIEAVKKSYTLSGRRD
jgi:phosphoribosylaminoimidazolecarboxamide formyltransferase/IMP cyclohydrolase